jgi:Zn-dependent alcohol dehydrogenase
MNMWHRSCRQCMYIQHRSRAACDQYTAQKVRALIILQRTALHAINVRTETASNHYIAQKLQATDILPQYLQQAINMSEHKLYKLYIVNTSCTPLMLPHSSWRR